MTNKKSWYYMDAKTSASIAKYFYSLVINAPRVVETKANGDWVMSCPMRMYADKEPT